MDFFAVPAIDEYGDTTYQLTAAGYTALVVILLALLKEENERQTAGFFRNGHYSGHGNLHDQTV